jgi:photosystem II stability/assembly factor-like uncharacterized protein
MTSPEEQAMDSLVSQPQPDNDPVYTIACPAGSPEIFAGRVSGLYHSPDGGASWIPVLQSLGVSEPTPIAAVAVSPSFAHDRTILAGVAGAALRSTDGGGTWKFLALKPPAPYLTALAFSPNFLEDGVILGGTAEDGILRSENGGDDWAYWNFGLLDLEILCLVVSPAFEQDETIFAGTGSGLFRSTNGGRAWKELRLPAGHVPILSLAAGGKIGQDFALFAGTEENGQFHSQDSGKSWLPAGAEPLQGAVNAVLASQTESQPTLAALVDGELLISTNIGSIWRKVRLPGTQSAISAIQPASGFGLDQPLLIGLETGEIIRLENLRPLLDD